MTEETFKAGVHEAAATLAGVMAAYNAMRWCSTRHTRNAVNVAIYVPLMFFEWQQVRYHLIGQTKETSMRRALLLVVTLAIAVPAAAQTIADNGEGRARVAGNEFLMDSKVLDPSAIRLGAPQEQGGVGKISFDVLGSSRKEIVLQIGAQSPGAGGEFSLNLLRPGGGSTDADMVKVVYVNHEDGFRFALQIYAPNLSGGGSAGDVLIAGPFRLYMQGDGNVVQYEIVENVLCARWSIWTGLIPKHTANPPCN